MGKICPTFDSFSCHGRKLTEFSNYLGFKS
jgi:hypothetical protein